MLSKLTILEILEEVQNDREDFFASIQGGSISHNEFRHLTSPIDLLIAWLSRELKNDIESSL